MSFYSSKSVVQTQCPEKKERKSILKEAGYNVFNIRAKNVFIDLLTDSGTNAMSEDQWAALHRGDESYAGSESFYRFKKTVSDVMGFEMVVPAHQGRGAENILYGCLVNEGDTVISNSHFDTTRAHVENQGGNPVDCPLDNSNSIDSDGDFLGNLSIEKGREVARNQDVSLIIQTITNNPVAGQPVSIQNLKETRMLADEIDAKYVVDAARFAENAYFVKEREPEWKDNTIAEIVKEQFAEADAITMSAKKDGLANIGGFAAVRNSDLFEEVKQRAILYEGFPTYGGLSGRDLETISIGLQEAIDYNYLSRRIGQVNGLAEKLKKRGIPVYTPAGGHAVYIDACKFYPEINENNFPGQKLVCELYIEGGVRTVEVGRFAFPNTDCPHFVRLALPRRVLHEEHISHVVETIMSAYQKQGQLNGLKIVKEPENRSLRHFTARLKPIEN